MLGICRGHQLINVALGGTLYQDIVTQVEGAARHVDRETYDQNQHEIDIVPGSGLAGVYGMLKRATVNSIHHQCVKTLGRGLSVEAVSPADGIIEAIRWSGSSYAVGLQWHPEFHSSGESGLLDGSPVLLEFLEQAARVRAAST